MPEDCKDKTKQETNYDGVFRSLFALDFFITVVFSWCCSYLVLLIGVWKASV